MRFFHYPQLHNLHALDVQLYLLICRGSMGMKMSQCLQSVKQSSMLTLCHSTFITMQSKQRGREELKLASLKQRRWLVQGHALRMVTMHNCSTISRIGWDNCEDIRFGLSTITQKTGF
uniref:Uncharacterized protein n=1 Tax=Eutreptiella gymnastica TaxID=73025 RepID=A0A7S4FZH6_9EUGL|mmetsp:Transcript_64683/g.107213  ORF Transcript_64683/g.107213 Transcript_64683/m.107213 type:complete len:118 (+) Transcript_64683:173-526(+)